MSVIPWGVYSVYKALGAHRTWGEKRLLCEKESSKSQHQSRNESHLQKMPYLKAQSVNVPSGRPGNKQSKWGVVPGSGLGTPMSWEQAASPQRDASWAGRKQALMEGQAHHKVWNRSC